MPRQAPEALELLVASPGGEQRELAWSRFLAEYSGLMLHVGRALGGDRDAVMDRYAFVLDALRSDDCRRLRAWTADGRGEFTTWLAIVVRRLCLDHHRHRYGRMQSDGPSAVGRRAERRNLADLVSGELALDSITDPAADPPDLQLERAELREALASALSRLDVEDRLILRLRFEDDLSVPEIARLLDLGSSFRLYRRINRCLATIRTGLDAAGIRDAVP